MPVRLSKTAVTAKWERIEAGDDNLELLIRPLGALDRVSAAALLQQEAGAGLRFAMTHAVQDWRGVLEADSNKPVPFSHDNLLVLVDGNRAVGDAILDRIGVEIVPETRPADPPPASANGAEPS